MTRIRKATREEIAAHWEAHDKGCCLHLSPEARYRRGRRLKRVFEGRRDFLEKLQRMSMEERAAFKHEHAHSYGDAVVKYDRARRAWRAFRGWQ